MSAQPHIFNLTDSWKAAIIKPEGTNNTQQEPAFIRGYHQNRDNDALAAYASSIAKGFGEQPVVVVMVNDNEAKVTSNDVKRVFKEHAPSAFA